MEEMELATQGREAFAQVPGRSEAEGDVPADECEAVLLEPPAQIVAVAQVTGRAELGSLVACIRDRTEHAFGPGNVGQDANRDLEGAVAARRVCDPDIAQFRRPSSVTMGTR